LNDHDERVSRGRRRRHYWIDSEIVRKEACKLAIQHHYFSPEWFTEFKDCLHCDFPPYHAYVLRELCRLLIGTETCKYCVKKSTDHCILDSRERN
jgi:hypothetical protein